MRDCDTVDPSYKCQMHGVLAKKPFGSQINKWNKRFFIIKDGFLLYYAESEKKEFEKKKLINTHPKGVVPLGGCLVEPVSEPGQPYTMHVKNEDITHHFVIAAETDHERDRWLSMLRLSSRITWRNAQLGDAMIDQLEMQGLQMAKERQHYFDKLQYEATALHDEKVKTEELERLNEELQREREKMEEYAKELREEYEKIKMELENMVDAMMKVEEDKHQLSSQAQILQRTLESLESEKQTTLHQLQKKTNQGRISQAGQNLSDQTIQLRQNLEEIESKTKKYLEEKSEAEKRLKEATSRAEQLEDDKQAMMEHAQELESSIKDLIAQKAITEAELKEEVIARLEAERRLREAEKSLFRLEKAVQGQGATGVSSDDVREEMIGDVKTLKKFFENLAFEAKLDAEKSIMIKNAIHARKTMVRRAKTMRFEASKKWRSNDKPCRCIMRPQTTQSAIFICEDHLKRLAALCHDTISEEKMVQISLEG